MTCDGVGTFTLPHIDVDLTHTPIGTYLAVTQGEELIVAWQQEEVPESQVLGGAHGNVPILAPLHAATCSSLSVLLARRGTPNTS